MIGTFSNILVLQLGDIGDVVLASPCFRALKEAYPQARVTALVRQGCGSLLEADPHLASVFEIRRGGGKLHDVGTGNIRLVRRLRAERFDLAIDLRTGDRGALLAWLSGAPVRVVYRWPEAPFWRRLAFTHQVDLAWTERPVHPGGDQSLRILRAIGIDTDDTRPRLYVSDADRERVRALLARDGVAQYPRFVTANPFSRWKYKEWGYEKWAGVFDRLWTEHALPAVIIGSQDEAAAADGIAWKCAGPVFNLAGKTTLGELAALISLSRLHLGVDSAAPHIAAAVGTPTVTIFGPSNWRSWTVEDATHRVARSEKPCVPCSDKGCEGAERSLCLDALGVETVMAQVDEVLRNV